MTIPQTAAELAVALDGKPAGDGWKAHCPAHDDQKTPNLNISEGKDGKILLHCFARCDQGAVIQALKDRGLWHQGKPFTLTSRNKNKRVTSQGCTLEQYTHAKRLDVEFLKSCELSEITYQGTPALCMPYRDPDGNIPAVRIRRELAKQKGMDLRFVWSKGSKLCLYGLWRLDRDASYVFVVEGESDCHTLWQHGINALGVPGATNWREDRDAQHLKGFDRIYIVIEPDAGGEAVRKWVAISSIRDKAKLVSVPGGDISELHIGNPDDFKSSLKVAVDEAKPWADESANSDDTSAQNKQREEDDEKPSRVSASALLVNLALGKATDLWHDSNGTAYATIRVGERREHWLLRSRTFKSWLARLLWQEERRAAPSQAMQDALAVLEGYAVHEGEQHEAHVRVAELDGNIYLDLCDEEWRTVEVTAAGWQVISDSPVRFRRRKGIQALPVPREGGNLDELREFINVSDKDWPLVKGWQIGCLNVHGPHCGITYGGEQGSGKSTSTKVHKRLIDPNDADLRSAPRNAQDLMIAASNSWVVGFDNLSSLRPGLSDDLARLATGAGFSTRTLFENDEETLFSACRPVLVNAIEDVVTRPDLLDRFIVIRAPRLPDSRRRDETAFWRSFEIARPRILGALIDVVSRSLRNLPDIKLDQQPRMLDFARFVVAAEPEEETGVFLRAYMENRRDTQEMALDADLVAQAIHGFIGGRRDWSGTAQELANLLAPDKPPKGWPATGQQMAGALRRAVPVLRSRGMDIEYDDKARPRRWILRTTAKKGDATDISDATRMNAGDAARHLSVTSRQFPKPSDGPKPAPRLDAVTSVTSVTSIPGCSDTNPDEVELDI